MEIDQQPSVSPNLIGKHSADALLASLRSSVVDVFKIVLGSSVSALEGVPAAAQTFERTAIVGLAGRMCAVMEFCCHAETAIRIAARMLHMESAEAESQALDAIGEMCNVVAGNFKHHVDGLGDGCSLSPPTVIEGTKFHIYSHNSRSISASVQFEGEPVTVVLRIKSFC